MRFGRFVDEFIIEACIPRNPDKTLGWVTQMQGITPGDVRSAELRRVYGVINSSCAVSWRCDSTN